ncbi:hypothetical protein [Daejeonella sp. JGW-45]|uniref:hypothetical protein n=1 Tax=Daejeonella sp. JGW-45 TaxID=3034148 RepID=UPI0023EE19D6|nr:hypothetical protein [Daejeonella sp. JGW-45]
MKNKSNEDQQGSSKSNQAFQSVKEAQKQRGISNSGGQMSFQTDNKQATINRGNENPNVQGKKQAPQTHSKHSPK